ncbi:MAG TPA: nicotinamide-nucleotide amidohydrolase family protein, partial [Erysipelothrix sp.]|nr:nicotinamide-nucleotide amidohydrolase family protein [Erysipelothrix sp.]
LIKPVIKHVKAIFKDYVYSVDIPTLEEALVKKLKSQNKTLATAESCTGGSISKRITNVSGSSDVFELGLVTYSNRIKHEILNVDQDILKTHGAVSKETAEAMSQNLLKLSGADIVVSVTGLAGPTGGSKEKPVGLVYINVATKDKSITQKLMLSRGYKNERERIRLLSTSHALKLVLDNLD